MRADLRGRPTAEMWSKGWSALGFYGSHMSLLSDIQIAIALSPGVFDVTCAPPACSHGGLLPAPARYSGRRVVRPRQPRLGRAGGLPTEHPQGSGTQRRTHRVTGQISGSLAVPRIILEGWHSHAHITQLVGAIKHRVGEIVGYPTSRSTGVLSVGAWAASHDTAYEYRPSNGHRGRPRAGPTAKRLLRRCRGRRWSGGH
jgi:hypothetical protein